MIQRPAKIMATMVVVMRAKAGVEEEEDEKKVKMVVFFAHDLKLISYPVYCWEMFYVAAV